MLSCGGFDQAAQADLVLIISEHLYYYYYV